MVDFSIFGKDKGKHPMDKDTQKPFNDANGTALSVAERCKAILDETSLVKCLYELTSWEDTFVRSLHDRAPTGLSFKQEKYFKDIEGKVFPSSSTMKERD